jgi:paraquat-inducible protein B
MSYLKSIFTGSNAEAAPVNFSMPGWNGGGLTFNPDFSIHSSAARKDLVNDTASNFRDLGNNYGDLRSTVAPGYNDLLKARLNSLGDTATKAIGDLRQNLQSRRILGSSFGQDTIGRLNAEFGRQKDSIVADNFLKSLDANTQLLKQQYEAWNQAFQTNLAELNLEAGVAQQMGSKGADILAQNARTTATLETDVNKANNAADIGLASGLGGFAGRALGFK